MMLWITGGSEKFVTKCPIRVNLRLTNFMFKVSTMSGRNRSR
jgi:hypothetical protein